MRVMPTSATAAAVLFLLMCAQACATTRPGDIPELSAWEDHMKYSGQKWCEYLRDPSTTGEQKLAATYYDAARVYSQIADYTGDRKWLGCVAESQRIYRDEYVLRNNGKIPGFWIFPHGIHTDLKLSQDARSREAIRLMGQHAAYSNIGQYPKQWVSNADHSREVAYNLMLKLICVEEGSCPKEHATYFLELALNDVDQWFVSRTATFIQPFMVGLVAEALIQYQAKYPDPRILPAIRTSMDYLWDHLWKKGDAAFLYIDRPVEAEGGKNAIQPAPDLNLLIAPAFAWLYLQTGDVKYRDRGDAIFAGGVKGAAVDWGAKQFNQNYRWSFDYVKWRREAMRRDADVAKRSNNSQAAR
jgi:hypothetical protein